MNHLLSREGRGFEKNPFCNSLKANAWKKTFQKTGKKIWIEKKKGITFAPANGAGPAREER